MTNTLFHKSFIVKDYELTRDLHNIPLEHGLGRTVRPYPDNKEAIITLQGTRDQIDRYMNQSNILSDRYRLLQHVPKYRIINTIRYPVQ